MRPLASCARWASRSSALPESGSPGWKASTAMRAATSPACAPPIPSATTKIGERASSASSLAERWRPVSLLAKWSATLSMPSQDVGELGVADPDAVPRVQRLGPAQRLAVEERAVGRAHVLEDHRRPLGDDPRVLGGREGV